MASTRTPLPERPRSYRFALTPLADAMFQLLIFFMLSTSLTPYSLITLKSTGPDAAEESSTSQPGTGDDPAAPTATDGAQVTIWAVGRDTVRVAGQDYQMDQLGDLAEAIGAQDSPGSVVIVVGSEARVQDVAHALEALEGANVGGVQITPADA